MSEKVEHVDADVRIKQSVTPAFVLQLVLALGLLAGIYAKMTANDEKLSEAVAQLRQEVIRIDREKADSRAEIRADLKELKDELRQLREAVLTPRK